jgi:hypothetical protein
MDSRRGIAISVADLKFKKEGSEPDQPGQL